MSSLKSLSTLCFHLSGLNVTSFINYYIILLRSRQLQAYHQSLWIIAIKATSATTQRVILADKMAVAADAARALRESMRQQREQERERQTSHAAALSNMRLSHRAVTLSATASSGATRAALSGPAPCLASAMFALRRSTVEAEARRRVAPPGAVTLQAGASAHQRLSKVW